MFSQRLVFALANTLAVLSALYIAFAFDLERPYWAVFSVFIVAAPVSGMVRSKAIYRWIGTIIGGAGALLMIPPLVHSPELLSLAMALWVGFWLAISLMDRTPRSYLAMLAGYTAAIVGLSVVDAPQAIFDTMVSRIEEISIGIACGALAHSLFFPRSVAGELDARIESTLRASARWIAASLTELAPPSGPSAPTRLSRVVGEIYTLNTHLAWETSDVMPIGGTLSVLQDRLASLLPALSSAERAIAALRASNALTAPMQAAIDATVDRTHGLADAPDILEEARPARSTRPTAPPSATPTTRWAHLHEQTALAHLHELDAALDDCLVLARALRDPGAPMDAALRREAESARRVPLYRDVRLALVSGVAAAAAVLVACGLWIAGAWTEGGIAAQFAAIGCSFFARLDQPAPMIRSAILGVLVALPLAALYEFAVFPGIDGFPVLALVLAPVFLALSYMQAVEKLAGSALVIAVSFSGALALQETYVADFAAFVNINLAEVAGLLIAMAVILVGRTLDPISSARRIARGAWRAIGRAAQRGARLRPAHLLDCIGQVSMRLDASGARDVHALNPLQDLRIGANLATVMSAETNARPDVARRLRAVREAIGAQYRARSLGVRGVNDATLASALDRGIGELEAGPPQRHASATIAALVSLRMDLLPDRGLGGLGAVIA